MSEKKDTANVCDENMEALAARWDAVAFRAQGSPFEDLTVACLAKNSGVRKWSQGASKTRGVDPTLGRYIYLSFEELMDSEGLDIRRAKQLLEICEATFLLEEEYESFGTFDEINKEAEARRMRFVEEFGLYQDFPVKLSNLDSDLRELCEDEGVETFLDLMRFLDRLADKAWIDGSYRNLQNVFAYGDEEGLTRYFPYRRGHRGFHLPEAAAFCLSRLPQKDLQAVRDYHERRRRGRMRVLGKRMDLPVVVEKQLLPELLGCLHYFGCRQPKLLVRLHDSAYLCRELMFLKDPPTESLLHWLIFLALGLFKPIQELEPEIGAEIRNLSGPVRSDICKELRALVQESGT